MPFRSANTLGKEERLCGKTAISALIGHGKWGGTAHFRFCVLARAESEGSSNRIMISVPKKFFKRAVKRNLLKRRIREAYRTQKNLLNKTGIDMMFQYNCQEILPYDMIVPEIAEILKIISK